MAESLSDKLRRMEATPGMPAEEKRVSLSDALRVLGAEEPDEDGPGENLIGTFMAIANRTPTPFQAFNENVSLGDFATGVSNMPGQAVDIAKSVGSAAQAGTQDLLAGQPFRTVGRGLREGASNVGEAFSKDPIAAAGAVGSAILPTRERIREDPLGVLFDAGAFAAGPGRLTSKVLGAAEEAGDLAKVAATAKRFNLASAPADLAKISNPISVTAKIGGKVIEKTGEWVHDALLRGASNKSGLPTDAIRIAEESAAAGGPGSQAFRASYKKALKESPEAVILGDVAPKFQQAINEAVNWKNLRYREWLESAGFVDNAKPINPAAIRKAVYDNMESRGWRIRFDDEGTLTLNAPIEFRNSPAEVGRVRDMVETLAEWTDTGIKESVGRKQALVPLLDLGPDRSKFKRSNDIIGDAFGAIDAELRTKVKGFGKANDDYRTMSEFIKRTRKSLGLKESDDALLSLGLFGEDAGAAAIDENFLTKIGTLLNDRRSQNLGLRKAFVKELERVLTAGKLREEGYDVARLTSSQIDDLAKEKGIKATLFEELAGAISADTASQGASRFQGSGGGMGALIGAGVGGSTGGFTGATVGAATGTAIGKLINNMTIRNPRAVAMFFRGLGMAENRANQIRQAFEVAKDAMGIGGVALGTGAAEGLTFGVAVDRMQKRTQDKLKAKSILSEVGIDLEGL